MSVDAARLALVGLVFALVPGGVAAQQDEHIFEPGKKHVCVPAADRRSWNCGSAEDPPAASPKADGPALRPARATELTEAERSAAAAVAEPAAEPPAAVAAPSPAAPGRNVPSYLLAPSAASAPVAASAPAEPASAPPPVETKPVETKPAEAPAPVEPKAVAAEPPPPAAPVVTDAKPAEPERVVTQAKPPEPEPPTTTPKPREPSPPPASVAAPPPVAASTPTQAPSETVVEAKTGPVAPPPVVPSALRDARAFRTLADARWVLELARGADRASVEAAASQASLPRGEVYLLPLTRDGASWYVALWGDFDSIDAARAARGEALAAGIDGVGFPRRVGPLKQELALVR